MKTLDVADATASLGEYVKEVHQEPLVITRQGEPIAALTSLTSEDWEDLVVSSDPGFLALIERSRQRHPSGSGVPLAEIRRKHGLASKISGDEQPQR